MEEVNVEKPIRDREGTMVLRRSHFASLLDFAALNAGRADPDALTRALHHGMDLMQIQVPPALSHIVGVTHFIAELRTTPAHITNLRHNSRCSSGRKT